MADAVKIEGLNEFVRNLKSLDTGLPKALRIAMNNAAEVVVQGARSRVPRRSGKAAASIKAKSTQKSVRISAGGRKAPYYPWLDFGGRVGRKHSVRRAFYSDGRYLYKSYFDHRPEFEQILNEALVDVARQAGVVID